MTSPTSAPGGPAPPERPATGGSRRRRAAIAGTGLVGGSLGLALRARGWHVSGWDAQPERAEHALQLGVLDAVGDDREAEVVFVATPAAASGTLASQILADPGRKPDVVVTDVSGVKAPVVAVADHPRFVGGHPMAGSEQVGVEGADADLFVGATWVLTPTARTDPEAFSRLRAIIGELGADAVELSPADHDRLVAIVSHVPHLVAATLMNAATDSAERDAVVLRLAAGGFRDMTRVAAGHPGIWPDICSDNAAAIVSAMDRVVDELAATRRRVAEGDREGIFTVLERASRARRALPVAAARPESLTELRLPVQDRPGVLSELSTLASDLGVNISNFEIAHSAEGPTGVMVFVVDSADAERLADAAMERGYRCTLRELA